ncbi:nuclear transport factor 2 family protein [Streptomyces sp. NPDC060275]|uniref:nuclear transport factor 2 family protein n=1 Tax=Streptomyces sp. NPDC060275 TaxID=3347090 RepID=UPI00365BC8C3
MPRDTATDTPTGVGTQAVVLIRLQQFYAAQVHALNDGDHVTYRGTFTTDAEFVLGGAPAPLHGAEAITEHSRSLASRRSESGDVQRHHVTMTGLVNRPGTAIAARSRTLITTTTPHGATVVTASTTCLDEFAMEGGVLRIRRRVVVRDEARD